MAGRAAAESGVPRWPRPGPAPLCGRAGPGGGRRGAGYRRAEWGPRKWLRERPGSAAGLQAALNDLEVIAKEKDFFLEGVYTRRRPGKTGKERDL